MSEALSTDGGQRIRFESWALSDRGRRRELNEDRFFVDVEIGVWAVADGMGGHDAGDLASGAIVDHFRSMSPPASAPELRALIEDRVARANADIQAISRAKGGATVGSTLAALITFGRQYACLWAGDSRVYLIRGGLLSQVSKDHTELQDLLDRGLIRPEEAAAYPRKNVITNAIGVAEEVMLDLVQGSVESGDIFIVCSDGLTAHVEDAEMAGLVAGLAPKTACEELIRITLERGAVDNVTVIVVECRTDAQ
ncbi:MAG: serine/threonine-protein phosphatase [Rhizobiaceae bacterium]|nr:serine/threonine-protein phosphatase [Rhizobiaceae bacterium]